MTFAIIGTFIIALVTAFMVGFVAGEDSARDHHEFLEQCYADATQTLRGRILWMIDDYDESGNLTHVQLLYTIVAWIDEEIARCGK